jgi:hypothetical protein
MSTSFWAENVGPMTMEEKQALADSIYHNTRTRTHAEFLYYLKGWDRDQIENVVALRRLAVAGVLNEGE